MYTAPQEWTCDKVDWGQLGYMVAHCMQEADDYHTMTAPAPHSAYMYNNSACQPILPLLCPMTVRDVHVHRCTCIYMYIVYTCTCTIPGCSS